MPRVNIEEPAFSDQRIELLGELAGYNRFEALGRLAHLWRYCTARGQYVVSDAIVASCLGPKGPDALVTSELGERLIDGAIRVKGTDGRIEWVEDKATTKRAGGMARAANAPRDARGRLLPRSAAGEISTSSATSNSPAGGPAASSSAGPASPASPADAGRARAANAPRDARRVQQDQQATSRRPAESSALLSSLSSPDLHPSARAIPPSTDQTPPPSEASGSDLAGRQALRDELWRELEAARARVAKALGVELRPLPVFDQGKTALAMRILEAGSLERGRADAMHVIRVREAEATATNATKWLSGGMFDERSWRTALASSLAEAKRQPARPAAHGPKTLRVQREEGDDAPPIRASMRGDT